MIILFVCLAVCVLGYLICYIVLKFVFSEKKEILDRKTTIMASNGNGQKLYILTGFEGGTLSNDEIKRKIGQRLSEDKIQCSVESVDIGFTGCDVGLAELSDKSLLGIVRLSGDVKGMQCLDVTDRMKLHSAPENAFVQSETQLQQHIEVRIPNVRDELVNLCKTLDLKVATEEQNVWLTGNPLMVSIAQNRLNKLYAQSSCDVEVECKGGKKCKELEELSIAHTKLPEDVPFTGQPTAYLCLALYLGKVQPPKDTKLFVVINEYCSQADLFARNTKKHPPKKYEDYFKNLRDEMTNWEVTHTAVYLNEKMPIDYRNILENVLEQMHQPTLFIKCRKRHWSCYVFPKGTASNVEEFVNNYLKVNTYKSLDPWWSELPKEILATKDLYLKKREQKEGPQSEEIEKQGLGEFAKKSETPSVNDKGKVPKVKPSIATKPGQKKYTFPINQQDIQYLYGNRTKEIQEIQAKCDVEVTFGLETVQIMTGSEEVGKQVEMKIKNILKPEKIHSVEVQDLLPLQGEWENGTILIQYMPDTVSAVGSKKLTEAFKKTLEEKNRRLSSKTNVKLKAVASQTVETCLKRSHGKSSKKAESKEFNESPPTSPTEEYSSQKPPLSEHNTKISETGPKPSSRKGLKESALSKAKHKEAASSKPISEPVSSSSKGKVTGEMTELISMKTGMKTYESETTGIIVKVGKSDITKLSVDAVVNAANDDLDHIGGVARAIKDAAGPGFDEECQEALKRRRKLQPGDVCVTGAGQMPAKMVFHAIGPAFDEYDDETEAFEVLRETFEECLNEAVKQDCRSVAIPAISSGAFNVPMDKVAAKACEALMGFLNSENTEPVRLVIFTDIREEVIELLEKGMNKLVKKRILKPHAGMSSPM